MTFDVAQTFYFKPEAGRIMVSPVDMAPSEPCDAQADELEVAIMPSTGYTAVRPMRVVGAIRHNTGWIENLRPSSGRTSIGDQGPTPEEPDPWPSGWRARDGNGRHGWPRSPHGGRRAWLWAANRCPSDIAAFGTAARKLPPTE